MPEREEALLMNQNTSELDSSLVVAIVNGDLERVKNLLDAGASPNACDRSSSKSSAGWSCDTPVLFTACERKFKDIVALLLGRGADPNSCLFRYEKTTQETIPSLLAAFPCLMIVELLLDAGANPNKGHWQHATGDWEHSPLSLAPTAEIEDVLRRFGAYR